MIPNRVNSVPAAQSGKLRRFLIRYGLSLGTLIVPMLTTIGLKPYPVLAPVISLSYLMAVTAAAWWGGAIAGILVSCAIIPALALSSTNGKAFLPPKVDLVTVALLFFISVLVSNFAKARRRVEEVLRSGNEQLEKKVQERTAELERAKSWLETTLASIGDGVIATDQDGSVVFANRVAEVLTGWSQAEILGQPLSEVFVIENEETRQRVENPVSKVLRTGTVVGLANHTLLLSRKGREIAIDNCAAPIRSGEGAICGVVLIFRDVTDIRRNQRATEEARRSLEQANQQLSVSEQNYQALAQRCETVREDERAALAREIHDALGGALTSLKFGLMTARNDAQEHGASKAASRLQESFAEIDRTIRSLRRLASSLRPPLLDEVGLVAALEAHADEFAQQTGIRVEHDFPSTEIALSADQSIGLYRIAQEALTNVARHSQASIVRLCLKSQGDKLQLTIHDNGVGFVRSDASQKGSLGLLGMQERAKLADAEFAIESAPGEGTTISAIITLGWTSTLARSYSQAGSADT